MIQPIQTIDGERDPRQAYAPHAYDLTTDTPYANHANDVRLAFIFEQHATTQKRLNMPMLIGEWGAFYESNQTRHVSLFIQRLIEKLLCSDTYWDYTPKMDQSVSFLDICRGYPMAVNGKLLNYRYEHALPTFQMKWKENPEIDERTIIYLPDIRNIKVKLTPLEKNYTVHPIGDSHAGFIEVPPIRNSDATNTNISIIIS